jgi:mannose-6-phosphate isomerase-like protein (cupin superfamily)
MSFGDSPKYVIHSIGPVTAPLYSSRQRPRGREDEQQREEFIMAITHSDTAISAGAVVVRSGEGQTLRWGPQGTIRIIAGASSTDRSFSIVETTEPPGGGAPLHVHHGEAEGFYILEGTVELTCGTHTLTADVGDFVYTPKDVPHKYTVVGDKPARLLMMFSRPGFEMFFAEGGTPLDRPAVDPPNPHAFLRLVEKYDMELLQMPAH